MIENNQPDLFNLVPELLPYVSEAAKGVSTNTIKYLLQYFIPFNYVGYKYLNMFGWYFSILNILLILIIYTLVTLGTLEAEILQFVRGMEKVQRTVESFTVGVDNL